MSTNNSTSEHIWDECLAIIRDNINEQMYDTWFEPIKPGEYNGSELMLLLPSNFFQEQLDEKFSDLILHTIRRVTGNDKARFRYRVCIDSSTDNGGTIDVASSASASARRNVSDFESNLNNTYDFDCFIEGECNRLPRTAGINIASQPGKNAFNPLFIYGKSGVGKTHLANAIGLKCKELHPQKRVLYVPTNLFQLQFTEASIANKVPDFINFYQSVDVLIIDDIQELGEGNKTKTQNNFFHIFNQLIRMDKQLIMTCDRKPAELEGIEDRLLSRFKQGLSAEIETPDFNTRKAILKAKIAKDGLEIPENIVDYIAENVNTNIRDLEGSVISLLAQSTINRKAINIDLAKKVIGNIVKVSDKQITIQSIRDVVCEYFHISPDNLQSTSRKREIVQARQIAMYFAKQFTQDSLATIGNVIGKRNHATVLHACKAVKDLIDTDKSFRYSVEEIEKKFRS